MAMVICSVFSLYWNKVEIVVSQIYTADQWYISKGRVDERAGGGFSVDRILNLLAISILLSKFMET